MDIIDLKEYLDIVLNMEKNIYLQNRLMSQMQSRSEQLGQAHTYQEPPAPINANTFVAGLAGGVFSIILSIIGYFILQRGLQLGDDINGLGDIGVWLIGIIEVVFGGSLLLSGVVGTVVCVVYMFGSMIEDAKSYWREKSAYDIAMQNYERNIRADKERVRKEQIEKAVLSSEIQLLQKQNRDSKQNLQTIYSKNIIFPKYRNLVMVCSIYEYICAGRCTTLEGHEGAYNILEMEIRLDRIITQLNLVVDRLDAIRNNQYMLYSAIQETNRQAAQILESTNSVVNRLQDFQGQTDELVARITSVEKNSALATYQTQSIQKELRYMNRMNYLSGKYDDVFYNSPPS